MAIALHLGYDIADVVAGPFSDTGTDVRMSEAIETRGEDPVERVHQDLDCVLHLVLQKGLGLVTRISSCS